MDSNSCVLAANKLFIYVCIHMYIPAVKPTQRVNPMRFFWAGELCAYLVN